MTDAVEIRAGCRVRMHFALSLADGTEATSTFGEEPLEFVVGDGTLYPALEENLLGLPPEARQTFLLTPEHGFGPRDDSLVHRMPRTDFPDPPEPGQVIAFAMPNGEQTAGTVLAVDGDDVRVDFNHPLAGRNLVFHVQILDVTNPGGAPA